MSVCCRRFPSRSGVANSAKSEAIENRQSISWITRFAPQHTVSTDELLRRHSRSTDAYLIQRCHVGGRNAAECRAYLRSRPTPRRWPV